MVLILFFSEAFERVCIVSITRFKPCVKSDEKDNVLDKKTEERTIKTVIHELGHTFGLHHCENYKCVMFFSNQISDTDNKSDDFCERCKKLLKINIKNELPGL
ncbi:MAG: hypothetical protein N2114_02145 [Candidatus Goldbacteria bacterium]|nr:hypothetical protein [Candidatus Goldiibacteriota bacterium]